MNRFKLILAVVYAAVTLATIASLWMADRTFSAWLFAALACGVPHWLPVRQED